MCFVLGYTECSEHCVCVFQSCLLLSVAYWLLDSFTLDLEWFFTQIFFMTHSMSMSILFRLRRREMNSHARPSWLTVKDQLIIKCEIKWIA